QPVETYRGGRCGRCGRKWPAPIRARKSRMERAAMSAAEALRAARMAGIDVRIEDGGLALEAQAPPSAEILELLAHHKPGIVALLRPGQDGWSAKDWKAYFDGRAGIAEFDGGLLCPEAKAHAFECCVVEWLNRNFGYSPAGREGMAVKSKLSRLFTAG